MAPRKRRLAATAILPRHSEVNATVVALPPIQSNLIQCNPMRCDPIRWDPLQSDPIKRTVTDQRGTRLAYTTVTYSSTVLDYRTVNSIYYRIPYLILSYLDGGRGERSVCRVYFFVLFFCASVLPLVKYPP